MKKTKEYFLGEKGDKKRDVWQFLLETGLAVCFLSGILFALRDLMYNVGCLAEACVIGVLVIAVRQSAEYTDGRLAGIRKILYIAGITIFVICLILIAPAFLDLVNRGIVLWNSRFGTEMGRLAAGSGAASGAFVLWALLALLLASFLQAEFRKSHMAGPALLLLLALWFGFVVGQSAMWVPVFFMSVSVFGMFIFYGAPQRRIGIRGLVTILGVGIIMVFVSAMTSGYQKVTTIERWKRSVIDRFEEFRYGKETLPEGNMVKAAELISDQEEDALEIQMDTPQELYLRGYVGADYHKYTWETVPEENYQGAYEGMVLWLGKQGFHPVLQYAEYADLTADARNETNVYEQVDVKNTGAYRKYMYLPVTAEKWTDETADYKKDWQIESDRFFGASAYGFQMVRGTVSAERLTAAEWMDAPSSKKEQTYLDAEAVYHSFVNDTYLSLSKKQKQEMNTLFYKDQSTMLEEKNFSDITTRIRMILRQTASYTEHPKAVPEGKNLVSWFLNDYKKGNAAYYASAAVLAYRAAGYPARYVEGYHLSADQAEQMKAQKEKNITLTSGDAHAWAEVYIAGIGWMPVETTPGMYVESYGDKKIEGKPSYQVNASKKENGADAQSKGGTHQKQQKEKTKQNLQTGRILAAVILILYFGFMVYLLLELQRFIRIRIRTEKEKEKEFLACHMEHVQYLLGSEKLSQDYMQKEHYSEVFSRKFPGIEEMEYRRALELIQKTFFGGIELKTYEKHTLKCFEENLKNCLYKNSGKVKRFWLRYRYLL